MPWPGSRAGYAAPAGGEVGALKPADAPLAERLRALVKRHPDHLRPHEALNFMTPIEFRQAT